MSRTTRSGHTMSFIASLSVMRISLFVAVIFFSVYIPISVPLLAFGSYPHYVDLVAVIFFALLAFASTAFVAAIRVSSYRLSRRQKRRENAAWWFIAIFSAAVLIGRIMYAIEEIRLDDSIAHLQVVPTADFIFAGIIILFAIGLILIPWTDQPFRGTSVLVDAALVIVSILTAFWPLLFGPLLHGELADVMTLHESADHIFGVLVLLGLIFWIIMQDIRDELWSTAAAFLLAVLAMVTIRLWHLSIIVASVDGRVIPIQLLAINAATSLTFLLISVAAVLRLRSVLQPTPDTAEELVTGQAPIRTWQIMLPYPIISVLLGVRLTMEFMNWGEEHRVGMIFGMSTIAGLLILRLLQMLRYNQYLYRQVAESAIRDGLTGLYNHRVMHDALKSELEQAQRTDVSVAVFFIDIDHFKQLNDTWGHKQGDRVLVMVADTLRKVSRKEDVVGRYGGEEFMVIVPDVNRHDAMLLGERFRSEIADLNFVFNGKHVTVTASVGIALYPEDSDDPELLIEAADVAMYEAKSAGRNVTRLYQLAG